MGHFHRVYVIRHLTQQGYQDYETLKDDEILTLLDCPGLRRFFQGKLKDITVKFKGRFKDLLKVFQGSFRKILGLF